MADEKSKIVTDATGPDAGPAPVQPEAGGGTPAPKQEQPAPEAVSLDKATAPEQATPAQPEKGADAPKEQKAASVSVFNFSEIMAEKKAAEKAATKQEAKAPDTGTPPTPTKEDGPKQEKPKEQEQAPKRRGRPPKEDKAKSAAPAQKEAPGKKDKAAQKPAPAKKAEKAPKAPKPAKGAPEVKAPVQAETPAAPAEAPRPAKDEQIVYIKLSELHAFKNHPFQVRNDEEMKAMVSSVRDKGVTQPAIVRPREDGGYEIVSGHRRQKASELAGFTDMPCIIRNLTDEQAITQMVEDNTNQRENILPSERAKALKMQLEAIKHQGAREDTSGQLDPKDAGRRSNEIVAERNKMTVKQVQRYIKLNDLVPDLQKMMDAGQIKFTPAVELAYIKPKNQRYIAVAIESQQSAPSLSQAQRMRELDQKGVLNGDVIDGIMMAEMKKHHEAAKRPHGRQSVKKLMNHYGTKSAMTLVGAPKDFDRIAKEFHVDYAFHKTSPGHYLLFFKADQADAITAAFSKYTEKVMGRSQEKPSILGQLRQFVEQIAARPKQKERAREAVKEER